MNNVFANLLEWIFSHYVYIAIIVVIFIIMILFIRAHIDYKRKEELEKRIKEKVHGLANNTLEMSPKEFMAMRKTTLGGRRNAFIALEHNFAGVYILYNKTKEMYYIGQAQSILNRVNAHFTGKGNGDVYADYKYGDTFTIRMIALENSGFNSLNELERHMISTYDAFAKGYNKTRGNK